MPAGGSYHTLAERFWKKVSPGGSKQCWIWEGTVQSSGYGVIRNNYNRVLAHRVSYNIANPDENIDSKVIMHSCDNPPCVNPGHLKSGSQQDNIADMYEKDRRPAACGEDAANSKLTWEDVECIRKMYIPGRKNGNLKKLYTKYGVSKSNMLSIVKYRTWKKRS